MADFLVVDGIVYDVLDGGADESESEEIGEAHRAIDGSLRSSVQTAKENYRFTLVPLLQADYLILKNKEKSGNFYACGGDAIVAGTYRIRMTSAAYELEGITLSFRRLVQLSLQRV